ncbi:efflux RND transporter permease subunit [Aquabacterium fontiphilum]|jgi:multidrug efflux pump|uniref:efflux RND transporter permease subunit n=1 Tax=Aquabacterium fontiphilum TaxID=450365 RepID=UPI001376D7AC|nr:efflux RND transporter permease subunit [Aquabacterium fontiphilum]NBD20796.1 efflux RND transporter permease subunit [Aquabacterium fontiphilum]
MAQFFINRPVFAWVIALFIMVFGGVAITQLPVSQYPTVAPPAIVITATYPGASARVLDETVVSVIEQELNGSPGLAYMESVSQANGQAQITVTFETGTDVELAQVDIQNRLSRATPRLPSAVTQQGVRVDKSRSNFLMFVMLSSSNPAYDPVALGDYAARNIVPELQRVPGVGQVQLFGSERAMRIWVDPAKLQSFGLSFADVNAAIRAQNALVSAGGIGERPNMSEQTMSATVVVKGQLESVEAFGDVVLRAQRNGATVRLKDVARIELGAQTYGTYARLNGVPAVGMGLQLSPTGNALESAQAVRDRMDALKRFFPEGMDYNVPYDTSGFVKLSIGQVVQTLFEAVLLVFLVMYLFLQNIRYTLIPTLVVPVALLGTFGVMLVAGFSINVLTMFGLVLAIGILVDDAIVVVENVERIMVEEGLPPLQATRKAMGQISGAIIGITVVLVSVFIPMAFFAGSVGNIYRQFSLSLATSMAFSALLALSLTPALCATFLKPADPNHHERKGFFGWFNRRFNRTTEGYTRWTTRLLQRSGRMMLVYLAIVAAMGWMAMRMPTSFLPNEDQGNLIVNIQLPPGATSNRTEEVIKQVEGFFLKQPEVESMVGVVGFSFSGTGQNAALAFVTLKDWSERTGEGQSAQALAGRAFGALMGIRDAFIFPLAPPAIRELGNATGFSLRLQDRGGLGHEALLAARNQLLGMAGQSKVVTGLRPDGLEDAPQLQIDIDRDRAQALGVGIDAINATLSSGLGSTYVNDFPNEGRMQRVVVQADAKDRMQPEQVLRMTAPNSAGQPVPLSAFATTRWVTGQMQAVRYNGYPTMRISGDAAAGYSTGQAMAEMEALAAQLPAGIGVEWTGLSREERLSGDQAAFLLAFSLLAVFLCLAALYESWSIPFAVLLVVPLGVLGAVLGANLRGLPNDVFFKVGLITIIGLSAKNAILIIEFARELQDKGMSLMEATITACRLRFRPIIMTSMAFILGVLPLVIASGAGSASQRAIGTGVMGGMISATLLAVFLVPVFFVVVRRVFPGRPQPRTQEPAHESSQA